MIRRRRRPSSLAVVLAAGSGSRYDGPTHKLLAPLGEHTVVWWSVEHAVRAGIGHVLVVTGSVPLQPGLQIPRGAPGSAVTAVDNPTWSDGQATSLALAVGVARRRGVDAIVVGLGDQPALEPSAWSRIAASSSPIAVAEYPGVAAGAEEAALAGAVRRGHPIRLARSVWPLLPAAGDEGARRVLGEQPDKVEAIACDGDPADVDTVGGLTALEARFPWN